MLLFAIEYRTQEKYISLNHIPMITSTFFYKNILKFQEKQPGSRQVIFLDSFKNLTVE